MGHPTAAGIVAPLQRFSGRLHTLLALQKRMTPPNKLIVVNFTLIALDLTLLEDAYHSCPNFLVWGC